MSPLPPESARQTQSLAHMADSSVLVVGLARDVEDVVRRQILQLRNALSGFRSVKWLVVESDSRDKTASVLLELAEELPGFYVKSLGRLSDHFPRRTERIAHCRNYYLREIRGNPKLADVDYVVVADLDGVNSIITSDAIQSCWDRLDWDVCTANQDGPYYDVWALRHSLWSPNDCWQVYRFLVAQGRHPLVAQGRAVYSRMLRLSAHQPWIEVDSAFGGLAIYKRKILDLPVFYSGEGEDGEEQCEHVRLHLQLRNNGIRIFINPSLINARSTSHSRMRWSAVRAISAIHARFFAQLTSRQGRQRRDSGRRI